MVWCGVDVQRPRLEIASPERCESGQTVSVLGRGIGSLTNVQYLFEWTDEQQRKVRHTCSSAVPVRFNQVLVAVPKFCPKGTVWIRAYHKGAEVSAPIPLDIVKHIAAAPLLQSDRACVSDERLSGDHFSRTAVVMFDPDTTSSAVALATASASAAEPLKSCAIL